MFLLGPLTQTECTRPDTLGPHEVGFLCVFVLNRGGVDCQFTDRLRHSQYTLMVIVVSTGRKRAEFVA